MALHNTSDQWSWLSKVFHWVIAVLIFIQIPLGYYADDLKLSPLKIDMFVWHKSIGMLILMLVILRLLWRIKSTIPTAIAGTAIEKSMATAAHYVLYCLMLALPVSGWVISSAANFPVKLFWLIPLPAISGPDESVKLLATEVHEVCVVTLILILIVHIGAAFRHHVLLHNNALKRMWF